MACGDRADTTVPGTVDVPDGRLRRRRDSRDPGLEWRWWKARRIERAAGRAECRALAQRLSRATHGTHPSVRRCHFHSAPGLVGIPSVLAGGVLCDGPPSWLCGWGGRPARPVLTSAE